MAGTQPPGRKQPAYRLAAAVLKPPMNAVTRRVWPADPGRLGDPGGVVVAVNHISHVDPLVVAHYLYDLGRPGRFLAKAALFEVPVVGRIVAAAGQIPVYRETMDAAESLRAAVAAVRAGECVVIYPEGTITRDRALWPMGGKTGAARVALLTGCPVIPMGVWGPQELLPPYSKRPRLYPRTTVQVGLGEPVPLDDLRGETDRPLPGSALRTATDRIMDAITDVVARLRGQDPPPDRLDPHTVAIARTGDAHVEYDWAAIEGRTDDRRTV